MESLSFTTDDHSFNPLFCCLISPKIIDEKNDNNNGEENVEGNENVDVHGIYVVCSTKKVDEIEGEKKVEERKSL